MITTTTTSISLDLLPVECLSQICSLLDRISLVQISLTSKQLWFVANNDKIWQNRFKFDFKQFYIENSFPSEWKQQYLNRVKRSRPYWKQESGYLASCK
jgi:CHASE1-domain containing sensor protein